MRKITGIFILGMLLLTGCGNQIKVEGIVEAEVQPYYSEVSGQILKLPVTLGQEVKKGDILAVIDDTDAKYALEQAEQTLTKAEGSLSLLSEGAEPELLKQSRNQVTIAEQNLKTAESNYQRLHKQHENHKLLYAEEIISKNEMEELTHQLTTAETAMETAKAQLDSARQQLVLLQKGSGTDSQKQMAEADVKQAETKIEQLTEQLDKYIIRAECDGRILSLSYTEGSLINAGSALLDISVSEKHYWVGYVPEKYADSLTYDQEVTIKNKDTEETAAVSYIDIQSQYAPKDYQSKDNRNKTSVKVKCTLREDSELAVGKTADLIFEKK